MQRVAPLAAGRVTIGYVFRVDANWGYPAELLLESFYVDVLLVR